MVLGKCGCPPKFVNMVKSLHTDMKARVNFGGNLSEPFNVDNGVKQGDLSALTLFAIYFAAIFLMLSRISTKVFMFATGLLAQFSIFVD